MKSININFIWYKEWWIIISPIKKIYKDKENYIYYSKWYYKWKKELDSYDWNRYHKIVKIFNDNWWIIAWCYWCAEFP